jgi:outer membrane protein assembly factor BamB
VAVLAVWLSAFTGRERARAEEGEPPAPEAAFHADNEYPDTYLNDSFEAHQMLESVGRLAERHRWDEAARLLDRVLAQYGDKLIRRAPGRYGPVAERVREIIGSWPLEGLVVYRGLFEAQARRQFEVAAEAHNAGALYDLLDRYYCMATGVEIADTLAQLHLEAGAFDSAETIYRELLEKHPDVRVAPATIAARLAVVAALAGDAPATQRWSERAAEANAHPTLRWLGQDRPLEAVVEGLLANRPGAALAGGPFEWPTFGGGNDRNRAADFQMDDAASLWKFERADGGVSQLPARDERTLGYPRAPDDGRSLTRNPVVAEGLIFVHDAFVARALRAETGVPVWTFAAFTEGATLRADAEDAAPRWYGAAYGGGRLYAVFGNEGAPYYGEPATDTPSTLVCLEALTGKELWRTRDAGLDETFSRCIFDPPPLVVGDQVFVVARRRRSFGFEDAYLCRFNADTGALEFRTHLGGASTGGFGFRRATMSVPTLVGDGLVVATNLGTVAAVNIQSGRVRWLTLYRRELGAPWGGGRPGAAAPWHYNPILADGDRLVCAPLDREGLLILDAPTGELRDAVRAAALGNMVSLLGIRDHVLYGLGDGPSAYDLAGRRLLWSVPLPPEERPYGRGLLTADRLLIPTRNRLCRYTLDGQLAGTVPWESPEDAGNVLALPDRCLVVGSVRISAYARKQDVWGRLRERMAAAPDDPVPALDMTEVALRGGDAAEALISLEEAIRRSGGLTAVVEPELKRRFFDICLALAEKLASGESPSLETAIRILGYAAQCPPDLGGEIAYRVRLAQLYLKVNQPEAAVEQYQQMIADRSLRSVPGAPAADGGETAGAMSRRQIDRLIELYGRKVYARFEARAREQLEAGTRASDLPFLERIVETYPNAEAAPLALIESGKILRQNGKPLEAVRRLSAAYRRYGQRIDAAQVMRLIADGYADAGRPESAWCWLTKAAHRYPAALLEVDGRRMSFEAYRARLGDIRARVEPSRPAMALPLDRTYQRTFDAPCHLLDPLYDEHPLGVWDAYYVYSDARLHRFDAMRNRPCWDTPAPCRMKPELLLATAERAVFATRHEVFALDARNGRRVWEYGTYPADLANELADHEMFSSFRVHGVGRDHLVSFQDNGAVVCLALATGEVIWQKTLEWRATGPVAVSDQWVALAALRGGEDVYAVLDLFTGEELQVIDPRGDRRAEQLFASLENLLVVTGQSIGSYDPYTGEPVWEVERERHISAETVQVDLDGLYFSDDGRHVEKIDLEKGRLVWRSDRLPFRFADGLSATLDREQLIVSTETSITALDAFDGRLLWEATIPPNALLGVRTVTDAYIVAVDTRANRGEVPYLAYFLDHRHADGRIAAQGGVLELGRFENVKRLTVRDHALLLVTENAVHGWCTASGEP